MGDALSLLHARYDGRAPKHLLEAARTGKSQVEIAIDTLRPTDGGEFVLADGLPPPFIEKAEHIELLAGKRGGKNTSEQPDLSCPGIHHHVIGAGLLGGRQRGGSAPFLEHEDYLAARKLNLVSVAQHLALAFFHTCAIDKGAILASQIPDFEVLAALGDLGVPAGDVRVFYDH